MDSTTCPFRESLTLLSCPVVLCLCLQVRVEQVLMMLPPLLLCYQLGQLTSFYHGLLVDILGPGAALSQAVASCRDVANR